MKASPDKEEILRLLYQNEDDYWTLPQYAMIPDWFLRYWELHNLMLRHLGEQPYYYPTEQFYKGRRQP